MKAGFVREVYLRSTPSVDLELVTEQVDCTKHTIPIVCMTNSLKSSARMTMKECRQICLC